MAVLKRICSVFSCSKCNLFPYLHTENEWVALRLYWMGVGLFPMAVSFGLMIMTLPFVESDPPAKHTWRWYPLSASTPTQACAQMGANHHLSTFYISFFTLICGAVIAVYALTKKAFNQWTSYTVEFIQMFFLVLLATLVSGWFIVYFVNIAPHRIPYLCRFNKSFVLHSVLVGLSIVNTISFLCACFVGHLLEIIPNRTFWPPNEWEYARIHVQDWSRANPRQNRFPGRRILQFQMDYRQRHRLRRLREQWNNEQRNNEWQRPKPLYPPLTMVQLKNCSNVVRYSKSKTNTNNKNLGNNNNADGDQDVHTCSICLGRYKRRERVRTLTQCQHQFHADCVDKFVLHCNGTCPTCREVIQ